MEQVDVFAKLAPHLSNPLALVGFVLLLVFGIPRLLVKAGLIQPLSTQSSGKVVRLLLHYGFGIALAVVVLGFALAAFQAYYAQQTPPRKAFPTPKIDAPSQLRSWQVTQIWIAQHPEILSTFGVPNTVKFIDVHDQPFARGRAIYNVTDPDAFWIFDTGKFVKTETFSNLTPGNGRKIDESVFATATNEMTASDRSLYRSLVEERTTATDFERANGIIGGIATGYIRNRFYDRLGRPADRERMNVDALYAENENYELIAGLRHGVGETAPTAPKTVVILFRRDNRWESHTVLPAHQQ